MRSENQNQKKLTALFCVAALFVGSILAPAEYSVHGKTKKPALNKKKLTLAVGKSSKLKVKNATGSKVTWKLKNKKIASIKKSGKYAVTIKAKRQGKSTLTAKVKKGKKRYTLSCKITIQKPVNTNTGDPSVIPAINTSSAPVNNGTSAPVQPSSGTSAAPSQAPSTDPSGSPAAPSQAPSADPSGSPAAPSQNPTTSPSGTSAAPSQLPSASPSTTASVVTDSPKPTSTPAPITSKNAIDGSTVKNTSNDKVSAEVSGGTATVSFSAATQFNQANFTIAQAIPLSNVISIQYKLNVTGDPDSVSFKLLDSSGSELDGLTQYNKKSGEYSITSIKDTIKSKSVGGYAIMTNSDIKDSTQTATATLESLTFTYVETPVTSSSPAPSSAPVITSELTMSSDTRLSSSAVDGNPVYHSDGSVTFTVTQQYGGGGLAFALDTSKTAIDLSDYSKVIFNVSADAEAPIALGAYTSSDFWNGRTDMASSTTSLEQKEIICNIPYGENLCGFGVKYNTYGHDTSTLPEKLTITIHSISLVKDSRDITDATTNYSKLSELAASYGFKMGTVMNQTNVKNPKYRDLMKYHFNSITAANEMKAYSMLDQTASKNNYKDETSMPSINFTNADLIMDYAKENGMKLRGHVLVWDADMCDWFFRVGYDTSKDYASADVIKARVKGYMREVITHFEEKYPGVIYCWDVVNEAVGDSDSEYKSDDPRHVRTLRSGKRNLFYDTIGEDYVELSFQYAHEIIEDLKSSKPDLDIKLYYNDYSTFYAVKRDAICELVKSINSYQSDGEGGYVKLCDGVGMQSYIGGFGTQSGCMNEGDINLVKTAIQKFASLGVEVQVTELAVRNYEGDEATFAKHADFYKKLFQAYIDVNSGSEKPLKAVSIWGIVDIPDLDPTDYSYRMNGPLCGLFNENLGVKPAFVSIHDLMKNGQ